MKREWMKGRITRIKHREISVPSAARFYGRQSMIRVVARARINEQARHLRRIYDDPRPSAN